MGRIRVLTDKVANQIAAGEVVERPASVCKELIENALDAGATQIRVELRGGGRSLIKVSDNGCGMHRDDALLAFERHATSKLRTSEDLLSIATLGFRGEALPSIASVARVSLTTRAADSDTGTVVEISGGTLRNVRDDARPPGTNIAVQNLFFNVPARRKFLRTERTELSHALRTVTHYSLANLDKAFDLLTEHGSQLHVTPVATHRERVYQIFGGELLEQLVRIEPVAEGQLGMADHAGDDASREFGGPPLRLSGFVSEPQLHRSNRNGFYIFVNGRLVRDGLIQKAIGKAYENLMPSGVYPFVLLFLEIAPEEVDVNVHPAKTEVRFRSPTRVFDFVRDAVRARLVATKPSSDLPPAPVIDHSLSGPLAGRPGSGAQPPMPGPATFPRSPGGLRATVPATLEFPSQPRRHAYQPSPAPASAVAPPAAALVPEPSSPHSGEPLADLSPANLGKLANLRLLGQLLDSFIVAAGDDGVWIIDQHVAHERILFEQVLAARLHGRADVQQLLTPIVMTLTPSQTAVYQELAEELEGNGFEIERFDGRSVAVKAAPAELSAKQVEALLRELLDGSRDGASAMSLGDLRRRMAATIACHAAIKINMPLTAEKMSWLLVELAKSDCPMACPHGRPIALRYGTREILKAFHRI
jgi:DNA mismatch repair protein MutL